jgi:hypothetical protein
MTNRRGADAEAQRTYEVLATDPIAWLKKAELLRRAARLSWHALAKLHGKPPALVSEERMAYVQSFMLLTAFSFENLIRGIAVANGVTFTSVLQHKGGHALKNDLSKLAVLSDAEGNLIDRLEVYLLWAGRYLVPLKADSYVETVRKESRTWRGTDLETGDGLFDRLAENLKQAAAENTTNW